MSTPMDPLWAEFYAALAKRLPVGRLDTQINNCIKEWRQPMEIFAGEFTDYAELLEGPADGLELSQPTAGWPEVLAMDTDAYGKELDAPALYVRASFPEHGSLVFYVHTDDVTSYRNGRRSGGLPEGTYADPDMTKAVHERAE
jgi:hypothetical protein